MNKKLLTLLGVGVMALSTGCSAKFSDEVLKDNDVHSWVVHGNMKVGELDNSWNGKSNELYQATALTPTSIKAISELDEALATKLNEKDVKHLYTIDVTLGENDAGWTTRAIKADGKLYNVNGSYAFKVAKIIYDEEGDVYAEQTWIPDPKVAHAEALTDNLFIPVWQEAADENGFSWANNIACVGGAGTYTLVAAEYNTASTAETAGFGLGLILKEAGTAATEDEEILKWVADEHTYGLVGSFASSNWADGADTAMTGENGSYTGQVTLEVDNEFKVRADGAWTNAWGAAAVVSAPEGAFDVTGDNIKCLVAGTYNVTIANFADDASAQITITAAE